MDIRCHGSCFPDQPVNLLVHKRKGILVPLCINILALTRVSIKTLPDEIKYLEEMDWLHDSTNRDTQRHL
jgi:hypothetical protein